MNETKSSTTEHECSHLPKLAAEAFQICLVEGLPCLTRRLKFVAKTFTKARDLTEHLMAAMPRPLHLPQQN